MTRTDQQSTAWRQKRLSPKAAFDSRKKSKADRERFRHSKESAFKRANDIYVDGLDVGRDRRLYVVVMSKNSRGERYATYNSHPCEDWIPSSKDVAEHYPETKQWTPKNFEDKYDYKKNSKEQDSWSKGQYLFKVPQPPALIFSTLKL